METVDSSIREIMEKVTSQVFALESVVHLVREEILLRKAIRQEWQEWNEKWKTAWLLSSDDELRIATSVRRRLQIQKNSFPFS
jgi:hypothetical protein